MPQYNPHGLSNKISTRLSLVKKSFILYEVLTTVVVPQHTSHGLSNKSSTPYSSVKKGFIVDDGLTTLIKG